MKHWVGVAALTFLAMGACNTAQEVAVNPLAGAYQGTYTSPDGFETGTMTLVIQPNNETNGTLGRVVPFPNSATISGSIDPTGAAQLTIRFTGETPLQVSGSVGKPANAASLTGTLSRREGSEVYIIQFTLFEPTS